MRRRSSFDCLHAVRRLSDLRERCIFVEHARDLVAAEYSQRHRADRSRSGQSLAGASIRRSRCSHRQSRRALRRARPRHEGSNVLRQGVKNSWGTFATSEWFLKEQPKQLAGLSARSSNASDTRQDREGTIAAVAKFSELDKALWTRMYDDLVGTFTKAGYVDEQTQKNDLAIVARSPTSLKLYRPGAPTTLASRAMPIIN